MGRYTFKLKNKDIRDNLAIRNMIREFVKDGCPDPWVLPFSIDRKAEFILRDSPSQNYIISVSDKNHLIQGLIAYSPVYGLANTINISDICARKNTRGNGRLLMEAMFADNRKNIRYLVTSVPKAVKFYEKFGFEIYDTHKGGVEMFKR